MVKMRFGTGELGIDELGIDGLVNPSISTYVCAYERARLTSEIGILALRFRDDEYN
jgi:hypothetical protein